MMVSESVILHTERGGLPAVTRSCQRHHVGARRSSLRRAARRKLLSLPVTLTLPHTFGYCCAVSITSLVTTLLFEHYTPSYGFTITATSSHHIAERDRRYYNNEYAAEGRSSLMLRCDCWSYYCQTTPVGIERCATARAGYRSHERER